MALDTDFSDFANAMKEIILQQKEDFGLTNSQDVYLFEVPQNYRLPAIFIEFIDAKITRMQPQQGQWEVRYLITIADREMFRPDREYNLYDKLATLIKLLARHPSLMGYSIFVEEIEAAVNKLGMQGHNQGANAASFMMRVFQEPVEIRACEL